MIHRRLRACALTGALVMILSAALGGAGCSGDPAGGGGGAAGNPSGGSGAGSPTTPGVEAEYPESILCPEGGGDTRCGPGFSPEAALSEAELEAALSAGLAAWTAPESNNGACVSCHSPDGVDLAWIGYSDCDIHRRALDHVSESQATDIVSLVHALRQKYDVRRPLHPDRFRPFQPGYEPFEQPADDVEVASPDAQARWDEAFADYLTGELKLTWATTRIDSLELARKAYDELVTIDLHAIKLGIPFDRFSEDPDASANSCGGNGGPAHSGKSIFEWVPDIALTAKPGSEAAWSAALDAYRAAPTTENLWAYYDQIDALTRCDHLPAGDYERACAWMRFKYKSMQVLQHMLRHGERLHPDVLADLRAGGAEPEAHENLDLVIARSPIWEAADVLRVAPLERRGDPACFSSPAHPCTTLPPLVDQSVHDVPSHGDALINQGDLFQLSWFVMSFLNDPTLTQHSHDYATFIGDYLESVMLPRYDVHHAFIVAVMAARKSAAREWLDAPGFRQGTGKIASVRTFSFKQLRDNFSPPPDGPRREVHARMFANFARMWIYLVEEDLRLTGEIYGRDGVLGGGPTDRGGLLSAIRFMRGWIAALEGAEDPAINALVASIEQLAVTATELRTADNYEDYEGLQPTGRWAEFQAPYAP